MKPEKLLPNTVAVFFPEMTQYPSQLQILSENTLL